MHLLSSHKTQPRFSGLLQALVLGTLLVVTQGCGAIIHAALVSTNGSSSGSNAPITVQQSNLLVSRGDNDRGPTTEAKGATVIALQLRLVSTIPSTLQTLTLNASGSGDDSLIPSVRLYRDVAGNGSLEQADPALGSLTSFDGDDGQARFTNLNQSLSPLTPINLIVTIDLPAGAADQDSFAVSIESSEAVELDSNEAITVLGAPVTGGSKTIRQTGTLNVFQGPVSRATT
ncbi:MAG: hypothetical protein P1V97_36870, partial [Planctomycetota bacterium]|nr:hypothetical protein [Planctomycetota bacterium]